MIEEMRTTLGTLEGQLQAFWTGYLDSKSKVWLYDRRKAAARLNKMQDTRRLLQLVQDSINTILQMLSDPLLNPPSEKED